MLNLKSSSIFFIAILFSSLMGCASTPQQEGMGEYVDDAILTTRVKALIFEDSTLKSMEIGVETFKGVVQLSGFVSSQANINRAVEIARGVSGVTSVKNDMQLKKVK